MVIHRLSTESVQRKHAYKSPHMCEYAVFTGKTVYLNIALCSLYTLSPHIVNKSSSPFSNRISNWKGTVIDYLARVSHIKFNNLIIIQQSTKIEISDYTRAYLF